MNSEECVIDDVNEKSGIVTLSFNMFGKESYKKSIKDIQVIIVLFSHSEYPLQERLRS